MLCINIVVVGVVGDMVKLDFIFFFIYVVIYMFYDFDFELGFFFFFRFSFRWCFWSGRFKIMKKLVFLRLVYIFSIVLIIYYGFCFFLELGKVF